MESDRWLAGLVHRCDGVDEFAVGFLGVADVVDDDVVGVGPALLAEVGFASIRCLVVEDRPVDVEALADSFADDFLLRFVVMIAFASDHEGFDGFLAGWLFPVVVGCDGETCDGDRSSQWEKDAEVLDEFHD